MALARSPLKLVGALLLPVVASVTAAAAEYLDTGPGSRRPVPTARGFSVRRFDAVVAQLRQRFGLTPGPAVDDETFVRRVFLDLIGRPPTEEEWHRFMRDSRRDKRARLVRELIGSDEFGYRWAYFWRQVLLFRVTDPDDHVEPPVLEQWLAERINAGAAWTEIVRELVTARGRSDLDGPANFVLAHMARPTALASETARVFLGVNIACAECHDDPAGRWKREDFHGFAAFFARIDERRLDRPPPPDLPPDVAPPPPPFEIVVLDMLGTEYKMPDASDPNRSHVIRRPRLLNGRRVPAGLPDAYRRGLLAEWLTHWKNFWFARAYVNRIWFEFFGDCFGPSPDDIGPGRPLRATRVLYSLASAWHRAEFNARWLPYVLARSDLYGRRCLDPQDELAFLVGVPRRRVDAYQFLHSLATALAVDVRAMPESFRSAAEQAFGIDPSESRRLLPPTLDQVLLLLNDPVVERWLQERARTLAYRAARADKPFEALCTALYVTALSRRPTERERAVTIDYLRSSNDPATAAADVLWALINSDEFLYIP